jgi:hypothetical protein
MPSGGFIKGKKDFIFLLAKKGKSMARAPQYLKRLSGRQLNTVQNMQK